MIFLLETNSLVVFETYHNQTGREKNFLGAKLKDYKSIFLLENY